MIPLLRLTLLRPAFMVLEMWYLAVHTNLRRVPLCNIIGLAELLMVVVLSSWDILLMSNMLGNISVFPGVPIEVVILVDIVRRVKVKWRNLRTEVNWWVPDCVDLLLVLSAVTQLLILRPVTLLGPATLRARS